MQAETATPMQVVETGDGLAAMRGMRKGEASVVITDPPYSPHVHGNGRTGKGDQQFGNAIDFEFDSLDPRLRDECCREFARITRRWVLVFSDLEGIDGWKRSLEVAGLEYVRTCIWHKPGAAPQFTGDRPASHAEAIVVAHAMNGRKPIKKRWNGGGRSNVWSQTPVRLQRVHRAQKPLKLMRSLVEHFSDRDDLVLDPFAGSGTTGVACKLLGRKFVGFELDDEVADLARSRIERTRINR